MHVPSCVLRCAYAKAQESGKEGKRSYTTRHATTSFKQEERECTHAGTNSRSAERVLRMLMMLLSSSLPPSLLYPILSSCGCPCSCPTAVQITNKKAPLQRTAAATNPRHTTRRYGNNNNNNNKTISSLPRRQQEAEGEREREREPIKRRDHG